MRALRTVAELTVMVRPLSASNVLFPQIQSEAQTS